MLFSPPTCENTAGVWSRLRGLSETEIVFLLDQQPVEASERRAVKDDELHAELEQQGQRDGARRRLSHLQQLADQQRAQLQQRFADLMVHLPQRQLKNLH